MLYSMAEPYIETTTKQKVNNFIKNLKNNKYPKVIAAKLLKYGRELIKSEIWK